MSHTNVKHTAKKQAGPKAVIFGVLRRDNLVHDGLLLPDCTQLKTIPAGEGYHILVREGSQRCQRGQGKTLHRVRVSGGRPFPFIKKAAVLGIIGVFSPGDGEVIQRASIAAKVLK